MIVASVFNALRRNMVLMFLALAVVAVGSSLVVVSQKVYDKQRLIRKQSGEIVSEEWAIRSLKAEWAYLSRPDRIDELSSAMDKVQSGKTPAQIAKAPSVMAISPVSFTVPSHPDDNQTKPSILPSRKPSAPSLSAHKSVPSSSENNRDFSNLLKTIGGSE